LATGGALQSIVLAAGFGARFGGGKLTAPWHGRMLIEGALGAAMAAPALIVTVVWGADEDVPAAARAYFEGRGEAMRLKLVNAEHHARGLSASLKAGIESLPADCTGAYLFLGDMPRVPHDVLEPLAEALAAGALAAAPVFDGQRGHPVLFGGALFADLLTLGGDKGAGSLLASLTPDQLALIAAPNDGVLYDVDLRTDLG
jgi:molybdenum cofactor cytidylyltransferase